MYIDRDEAAYRCLAHVEETWSLYVFAECRNAFAPRGVAERPIGRKGGNTKRARKEESYLEDEYLRARRKNLRSPWPAAAIEGIGAGEQRRLSQRKTREGRHFRVPLPLVGHRLRLTDSSAPNPLDRLRPLVAVRGTLLVGARVISLVPCEDI